MSTTKELLIRIDTLKNMLVAHATGENASDAEYRELRADIMAEQRLKQVLPQFLHTCRTIGEFWGFIKNESPQYQGRRNFLRDAFHPVLSLLEDEARTPGDGANSSVLSVVDSAHVQDAWRKAVERRAADPEGAITSARTLLETVCKHILDEEGEQYDASADLPKLYKLTATKLNLAPEQHQEQIFKQILGGCQSIADGLAGLRNRLSDAHGKGKLAVKPAQRHAGLAVNVAGAMATFLIETWEAKRDS